MKEIKLRIKSVESTMQITKAMELVASSKLRRAKERVENSRPYFETLYATLFDIAAADSEFSSPYLAKCEKKCCLYIVIAGDRGLAGGYNSNILKAVEADAEGREYCVLPIGKKAVEYFERHKIRILTDSFAIAGDISVSDCFEISRLVCQKFLEGGCSQLGAQRQCNTTGMEATGITIQAVIIVRNTQFIDRSILTVIDNTGFSRISAILIIVHTQSRILIIVIYQIVIADAAETYTVLNIYTKVIGRQLGDDTTAQSQHCRTGDGIQFCTSGLLAEAVASGDTLIIGR